jgi:anaerobic selenocysteine-containing dehydrogenase
MVGETVAFQSNGPESVRAIQLLNVLTGNLNRPGGIYPTGSTNGPEDSFSELLALIKNMNAGQIKVALIKGNPRHAIPPATGFQEALDKVPFTVSFSSLLDDTALQADLIMPGHSGLESWGDVIPLAGSRHRVYGLMQPVVSPLHDTRQFGDVLLAVASRLGGAMSAALPQQSFVELVKTNIRKQIAPAKVGNFEELWVELLRQGGHFNSEQTQGKGLRWNPAYTFPDPDKPRFAGAEKQFPLHLQAYPSTSFYDGRGAPLPWLQQLPDPMSTAVWDSWVEINPQTAAGLGISQGDLVEVTSLRGSLRLPAVIYPAIRPDMVAIPLGQGHKGGGRYASNRGVNPLVLLALPEGSNHQAAWNATMVRVTRVSKKGELVTAGHPQGSYRSDLIGI